MKQGSECSRIASACNIICNNGIVYPDVKGAAFVRQVLAHRAGKQNRLGQHARDIFVKLYIPRPGTSRRRYRPCNLQEAEKHGGFHVCSENNDPKVSFQQVFRRTPPTSPRTPKSNPLHPQPNLQVSLHIGSSALGRIVFDFAVLLFAGKALQVFGFEGWGVTQRPATQAC